VFLKIPDLVAPLGDDSQRILQEGDDDEKPANRRQVGSQRLRVNVNVLLDRPPERLDFFHGIIGVGSSVTLRWARVGESVRVWGVAGRLGASDADASGHFVCLCSR
jgi:hypothetical protein